MFMLICDFLPRYNRDWQYHQDLKLWSTSWCSDSRDPKQDDFSLGLNVDQLQMDLALLLISTFTLILIHGNVVYFQARTSGVCNSVLS